MDYYEWDGTESGLDNLLIWWGTRIPWEHSPDCGSQPLHCCTGISEFDSDATLSSTGHVIYFSDGSSPRQMIEAGDRIYYRGYGKFELVKK